MIRKTVAIIGAGPSGLAAAKAALEQGLQPTVFEAANRIGGLWRIGGYTWRGMRTNISKYNCAFSDFPWPDTQNDFPKAGAVAGYLQDYATRFNLDEHIETNSRVTQVRRQGDAWAVSINDSTPRIFDGVIAASGIFAQPNMPAVTEIGALVVKHSAYYCGWHDPRRTTIVGGLMSGVEIAAHVARKGGEVDFVTDHPVWILPRVARLDGYQQAVPLDLALNRRDPMAPPPSNDRRERFRKTAAFFESQFGNPGKVHSQLGVWPYHEPPQVAVSDDFLKHVKTGAIQIYRGRLKRVEDRGLLLTDGRFIKSDRTIACTGYRTDLSYLGAAERMQIGYREADKFLPFVADSSVFHPQLPGLCFVGLYRGPYFGVMELQARYAAMLLAGTLPWPQSMAGVTAQVALRAEQPRTQFPLAYMPSADALATRIGCMPNLNDPAVRTAPMTPAQFRLQGPNSNPESARRGMAQAAQRLGIA